MYYTGKGLVTNWDANKSKAVQFTFKEASKFVGLCRRYYIEEILK